MTMKMNKRRKRYANLRSMSDLRNERTKLRRMMKANEADLAEDRDDIRYMLSPSNIMDELMCRISARSSVMRYAIAGVRALRTMISRHRESSCKCH